MQGQAGDADLHPRLHKQGTTCTSKTVLKSDFDYLDKEFTGQAIANRRFRRMRITPLMRWQFKVDLLRMMDNIRRMRPSIDNRPPETPSPAVMFRNRQKVEEGKLKVIEVENHEMLERLRNIHNRPTSKFCYLKKKGVPLIRGDAFRLKEPTAKGLYIVEMYKKLKLANPLSARKSIRMQQEMLTSALDLVSSKKNQPSEELLDSVVQMKLAAVDEVPREANAQEEERLSPVQIFQQANPYPDEPPPLEGFDDVPERETSPSDAESSDIEVAPASSSS